ncbi:hypothetical protein [Streptomyces sp. 8L]|uniref:hypothetical protein n=1 Tax=Streptomyces sp. 8L TaxID=2877242 RepID=UPI001CD75795|nr:hypothetical protein [Streptomyces sp. 8L]MCA1217742.1 hypothetical protein [Streptomyces sp. 8L]
MDEFTEAVLARVGAARRDVLDAVAAHDARAIALAVDELEEGLRVARTHGIDVRDAASGADEGRRG